MEARAQLTRVRVDGAEDDRPNKRFLRRFPIPPWLSARSGPLPSPKESVGRFGPLLDSWKAMTLLISRNAEHLRPDGEQAAEQYKSRLENVSNQWMLATGGVAGSPVRGMISGIAATAEEKLPKPVPRFAGGENRCANGEEMAQSFTPPIEPSGQRKSANTGA